MRLLLLKLTVAVCNEENEMSKDLTAVTFVMSVAITFLFLGIYCGKISVQEYQYKQGQIDAIQGDVKYHLVDQPDGSRAWKRRGGE